MRTEENEKSRKRIKKKEQVREEEGEKKGRLIPTGLDLSSPTRHRRRRKRRRRTRRRTSTVYIGKSQPVSIYWLADG